MFPVMSPLHQGGRRRQSDVANQEVGNHTKRSLAGFKVPRKVPIREDLPTTSTGLLEAGSAGVAFVRSLFDPRERANGDFTAIRNRASEIIRRFTMWRSRSDPGPPSDAQRFP
jgi:hypothetical protein